MKVHMDIGKLKFKSLLFISSNEDENIHNTLNAIFREVFIEKNHQESVNKYFGSKRSNDTEIDVILYELNENNIIHLKQIRDLNHKIPIFTISSDYTNIDALLLTQQKIYYSF